MVENFFDHAACDPEAGVNFLVGRFDGLRERVDAALELNRLRDEGENAEWRFGEHEGIPTRHVKVGKIVLLTIFARARAVSADRRTIFARAPTVTARPQTKINDDWPGRARTTHGKLAAFSMTTRATIQTPPPPPATNPAAVRRALPSSLPVQKGTDMPCKSRRPFLSPHFQRLGLRLAAHRGGRVVLHLSTLARSRKNFRWHLRGVLRELRAKPPGSN
ncbi:MAG: hypothetical protein EXS35_03360 [Pedosphaera sp.]|nr:hypothetical protein [Pedosphaera sp.]